MFVTVPQPVRFRTAAGSLPSQICPIHHQAAIGVPIIFHRWVEPSPDDRCSAPFCTITHLVHPSATIHPSAPFCTLMHPCAPFCTLMHPCDCGPVRHSKFTGFAGLQDNFSKTQARNFRLQNQQQIGNGTPSTLSDQRQIDAGTRVHQGPLGFRTKDKRPPIFSDGISGKADAGKADTCKKGGGSICALDWAPFEEGLIRAEGESKLDSNQHHDWKVAKKCNNRERHQGGGFNVFFNFDLMFFLLHTSYTHARPS